MEYVELFARFFDPDRFSVRAAKDHDRWSQSLTPICPMQGRVDFFSSSNCLSDQAK
jgi:hypothetical protein